MAVGHLCNRNVVTVPEGAEIADAARAMRDSHVGDVVVTKRVDGKEIPTGIVTDRDMIVEVIAPGVDPAELKVEDIMSSGLVTVHEDNSLELALREMERAGIRRMPVIDADGALIGILTIDDVLAYIAQLVGHVAGAVKTGPYIERTTRP